MFQRRRPPLQLCTRPSASLATSAYSSQSGPVCGVPHLAVAKLVRIWESYRGDAACGLAPPVAGLWFGNWELLRPGRWQSSNPCVFWGWGFLLDRKEWVLVCTAVWECLSGLCALDLESAGEIFNEDLVISPPLPLPAESIRIPPLSLSSRVINCFLGRLAFT